MLTPLQSHAHLSTVSFAAQLPHLHRQREDSDDHTVLPRRCVHKRLLALSDQSLPPLVTVPISAMIRSAARLSTSAAREVRRRGVGEAESRVGGSSSVRGGLARDGHDHVVDLLSGDHGGVVGAAGLLHELCPLSARSVDDTAIPNTC